MRTPVGLVFVGVALGLAGCGPELAQAPPPPTPTPVPFAAPADGGGAPPTAAPANAPAIATVAVEQQAPAPRLPVVDLASVVERVKPAVVTVVNQRQVGDLFEQREREAGRGTGFVIDEAGHVVTNEHVVRGGDAFQVILSDGTVRPAELVGADPLSDLAVVRIEGEAPAIVAFGDSEALRQGQPVLAIGSPLGDFTGTVTDGIVSALNRDFPGAAGQGEVAYTNLIQHNAAINPGNSGGPLFDLDGRVIGVNTLGIPQTQAGVPAQGLFFAIPSNTVSRIALQIINEGRVAYPYLGGNFVEVVPEAARVYDLPVDYGAFVQTVVPGGPADDAGIAPGDIIVAIGGQPIDADTAFTEALFASAPGEAATVEFVRGDERRSVEVQLEERRNP